MPSIPASIIRLTALPPPPPTPITFIRAPVIGGSSSMKMLMPLPGSRTSGVISYSSLPYLEGLLTASLVYFGPARPSGTVSCGQYIVPTGGQHTTLGQKILLVNLLRNLETKCVRRPLAPRFVAPLRCSSACARCDTSAKPAAAAHEGL